MATTICIYIVAFFSYDGYSVPDRTGAAQYYHPIDVVAPKLETFSLRMYKCSM